VSDRPVPPQRGDEQRLFERYDRRLRRSTQLAVNTSPDIVDDACAFAWMTLLTHQPRRETVFAWLRTVARREAIRLDGLARRLSLDDGAVANDELPARRDGLDDSQALTELRERLQHLTPRQREVVFLHAAGWRYADLAERLGVSHTRINRLLSRASAVMREIDMRELDVATSPRGQRLREVEDDPPSYIVAAIGRPPRADPKNGGQELRRDWKRLVLAIEDYRTANGVTDQVLPLGVDERVPERDVLARRIAGFRRERGLGLGLER
jgi:RNA polymerase sigma factor (sigma-70 family)